MAPQFDYVLHKKEELLKRINIFTFEKECILNFDIVDTLLECNYTNELTVLFNQLLNEQEITIRFIDEYIDRAKFQDLFVIKLCSYWHNIWRYILSESSYIDERKEQYFLLIMKYAKIEDLKEIFNENDSYIANYSDFFIIDMDNNAYIISSCIDTQGTTISSPQGTFTNKKYFIYKSNNKIDAKNKNIKIFFN